MRAFIGITDGDWYRFLRARPDIDEVNFWQPGGNRVFTALKRGEPFLFKLHSPEDFIVGGGFFAHATLMPVSVVWDSFEEKNGATSLEVMRARIQKYRPKRSSDWVDYTIGCILLTQPFFFDDRDWIPAPESWPRNTVQGKTYPLDSGEGREVWERVQLLISASRAGASTGPLMRPALDSTARYGSPILTTPRLGQGSFRILVTDVYERRCAVTGERTLPVLQAAHIWPFGQGGPHRTDNGLLLRSDLHTLFDRGYVTITPEHRFEVSRRIREEFENGRDYYALRGREIRLPENPSDRPNPEWVAWHNTRVFRG